MKKRNKYILLCLVIFLLVFTVMFTNGNIKVFHKAPINTDLPVNKQYNARIIINSKVYAEEPLMTGGDNASTEIKASDYTDAIDAIDGGSMFESIIATLFANCLGALMAILGGVSGIKSLDGIVFNVGQFVDGYTPIATVDWSNISKWYDFIIALTASLLFIAVLTIYYKFIKAAGNVREREEAIGSLKRLGASAFIISLTPILIHLLIFINNNFVYAFYSAISSSPDGLNSTLGGPGILSTIGSDIGSPLAGVIILAMFAVIQIKINIIFIIRTFNIIVYTVFTPVAATLWIIDSNINGAKVWLGELLSNIFMQSAYAFLFAIYISFMGGKGWLTQLVWANLIMTLADVLRNSLQGKLTEMSGMNEGNITSKILGSGLATMGGISGLAGTANAFRAQARDNNKSSPISTLDKPIEAGNKAAGVAGKLARGAFKMVTTPMAAVSGNSKAMRTVNDIGAGIEKGVSKVTAPIARVASIGADKISNTKKVKDIKSGYNNIVDKVPKRVKDFAKVASGNSSDDIFKFK